MGRTVIIDYALIGRAGLDQNGEPALLCESLRPGAFRRREFAVAGHEEYAPVIAIERAAQRGEISSFGIKFARVAQLPVPGLPQGVDQPRLVPERGERQRRAVSVAQARELLLVEILEQLRTLFGASDPWLRAADLGRLFAELTLQQSTLPDDLGQFITRLRNAYGTPLPLAALGDAARLVHTLWQAWHRQQRDAGGLDPETTYLAALRRALDRDDRCIFFMAGNSGLAPPERAWAQRLAEQDRLT